VSIANKTSSSFFLAALADLYTIFFSFGDDRNIDLERQAVRDIKAIATMLGNRGNYYEAALAASKVSRLGLRVFLLATSGSLAQSYLKTRVCHFCGVSFSFEHFLCCPELGDDLRPHLLSAKEAED
jgi:hypothetical protein